MLALLLRFALAWPLVSLQVPEPPELPPAGVVWTAPTGCPDRAALLAGIERRLARPLAPDELALDARVRRDGSRWKLQLRLEVGERSEQRELGADSCAPLVDATALLVVHAIAAASEPVANDEPVADEEPTAAASEPIVAPEIVEAPAVEPREEPVALAAPPPPAPRGPGLLLRVHGGAELGAVPGLTGAVGLGLGVLFKKFRLEARGTFVAPRGATRAGTDISALLFAGSLHACARFGRGALELPVCGGLELGGVRGAASGPTASGVGVVPWLGVVLGAGVSVRLRPRLALWSALELVGGVVRPNFVLRDPGAPIGLFRSSPVSGRLLVGLELRLRDPR